MYYNSSIKEDSMYKHLRQVKQDIDQSFEGLLPRETMSVHTIARKLAKRMGAKHGMRFVSVNEPIGKRHADGELFCGGSFYPWYADENDWYDRYQGVDELMPYAKAVSAKSHEFNENGEEINTDFSKMLNIISNHNYDGYIGIEYEGSVHTEFEGITLTRDLLKRYQI